eukprot:Skav206504  [mRNA]  locus=scaffold1128:307456:310820:+ [translate_table: standard]
MGRVTRVILWLRLRPSVREEAAAALGNLVFFNDETNAGNQAAIAEAGAVPYLAALLKDPKAQVTAAGALRNLAAQNVANQEPLALGWPQEAPRVREVAAGALWALARPKSILNHLAAQTTAPLPKFCAICSHLRQW